jgi:hypothetical protein
LQDGALALTGLQTSPQALQLLVVFSVVHVPPHVVSVHTHDPLEQVGLGWAHGAPLTHAPPAPQVWGTPAALQSICPGAHEPEHTPETQVLLEQVIPFTQLPALHVCTLLLLPHCRSVGAHEPVHTPLMHVW